MKERPEAVQRALAAYGELAEPRVAPIGVGLLHQTFYVSDRGAEYVLQRVNPVFSPRIHENIRAVTEELHLQGIATLRLLPASGGALAADLGRDGLWRLMTRVPGVSLDRCPSADQARAAGALVARFHSALDGLDSELHPIGFPFHDTPAHLSELERALATHRGHRLHAAIVPLAGEILREAAAWEDFGELPARVTHGDLKLNNLLFEARTGPGCARASSLIDLDTLARRPLYQDLGDAWRSWCNRRGEGIPEAELDLELFRASAEGYLNELSIPLGPAERVSLAHGIERMSLELAARFAADALDESYFGWDADRFPNPGEHNRARAEGQLSLFRQARATRSERLRLLGAPNP